MSSFNYDVDTWKLLDRYFDDDKYRLVENQIDSYNDFTDNIIPSIIANNNPITIYDKSDDLQEPCTIEITNPRFHIPMKQDNNGNSYPLFPFESRTRQLSYMSQLIVDVEYSYGSNNNREKKTLANINLCKIPCMLQSNICNLRGLSDEDLKSKRECIFDLGGYFIINGGEKVIVSQERVAENRVYVWPPSKGSSKFTHECEIKSSIDQRFNPIEGFKVLLSKSNSTNKTKQFYAKVGGFNTEIPLFVLMRALGVTTDKEIFTMILGNNKGNTNMVNLLKTSCVYNIQTKVQNKINNEPTTINTFIYTQEDAINFLSTQLKTTYSTTSEADKRKIVTDILNRKLLPHCGFSYKKKAMFVAYMANRLMLSLFKIRPYDDRDHYSNKRLNTAGTLLAQIFRTYYINHIKEIKKTISLKGVTTEYTNLSKLIGSSTIESRLKYVLSTGNWNTSKNKDSASDKGVAQVLTHLGYYTTLSLLRRVHSPLENSGNKIIQPRKLHMTHFGMCCPNETPEGQQIGVVKNLALQCKISIHHNDYPLRAILKLIRNKEKKLIMILTEDINIDDHGKCTKIMLNGDLFGYVHDSQTNSFYETLLILKRHTYINIETSIAWYIEWNEIHIQTDGGRYMRPVHIVDDSQLLIDKHYDIIKKHNFDFSLLISPFDKIRNKEKPNLYNGSCIEYIDTNQTENSMIAMTPLDISNNVDKIKNGELYVKYTHCEIHPTMMLSAIAQMIPYSDCNQSPRNIYQSSMGKQAIGTYATNYNYRFDTMGNILIYGERPLNSTRTTPYTKLNHLPHGINSMLLIGLHKGYNQEDATCFNEDAIDRGFFNTLYFRSHSDTEVKHKSANNEQFTNPSNMKEVVDNKIANYSIIDDSGVPKLNMEIEETSAIIGKIVQIKDANGLAVQNKDVSTILKKNERGFVDAVIPTSDDKRFNEISNEDSDGNKFIMVRISKLRKPEVGDKFASRHSQKGVMGKLVKSIDMPFNDRGETADIIMNPHGIPSRMTQGKIFEMLGGKTAVCSGFVQDGTPFTKRNIKKSFQDVLNEYGFDPCGNDIFYNGKTGKMYEIDFYYCPTYYQRLKHMVADKIHSRDTGPVQILTRQPADGRARDGGHRIGEMERDAMISHGMAGVLKENFMEKSDKFRRFVDTNSGNLIIGNEKANIFKLNSTDRVMRSDVTQIELPYALNLGIEELNSVHIGIKLIT